MKKLIKYFVIICFSIALGLQPTRLMAEEVPADAVMKLTSGETVTYFDDIQDAIAAVNALTTGSHELVVLQDVETLGDQTARFEILTDITLDLNGKTLKLNNTDKRALDVKNGAHLTVVDAIGRGVIENNERVFNLENGSEPSDLTVKGGTFNSLNYAITVFNKSTVKIEGGTFNGNIANTNSEKYGDVKIIISGGKFNGMFYLPSRGNVINISGGEFTPVGKKAAIEIRSGELNISGGTFTNNVKVSDEGTNPEVGRSGDHLGVIVASKLTNSYPNAVEVNITGGQFNNNLGDILVLANYKNTDNLISVVANVASGVIADEKIKVYDEEAAAASKVNRFVNAIELNGLVAYYETLIINDFTTTTYNALTVAVNNLKALEGKNFDTQTEILQRIAAVENAFDNLVDLKPAKEAYALYTRLNLDPYTKDTKDAFTTALNALDAQIKNANVTAAQLVTAVNNVKATNAALRKIDAPVVIEVDEEVLKEIGITAPTVGGLDTAITFTPQEIAAGAKAEVALKPRTMDTVAPAEKVLVDAYFANLPTKPANVLLLDISLNKVVGGNSVPIANANGSLEIAFGLPAAFKNVAFHIIRIHDGVVEVLPHVVVDGVVTFETDKFSTYGIVEGAAVVPTEPDKTPPTGLANDYALYMMTLILASAVILFTRKRKYN